MPIYEYRCDACQQTIELFLKSKEEAPRCPKCGSDKLAKLLSTFSPHGGEGGGHDHAGGGCSCCPSAKGCPANRNS